MNLTGSIPLVATPYSERRKQTLLEVAPRLTIACADSYVAGMTAVGVPYLTGMQAAGPVGQSLTASAKCLGQALPLLNGALAVGHGIAGWVTLANLPSGDTLKKAAQLKGLGEIVTGLGFAGQAFGFGALSLPVTAIGLVAMTVGQVAESRNR